MLSEASNRGSTTTFRIGSGDEEVVADDLDLVADLVGQGPYWDDKNQDQDLGIAQPDFTGGFSTSLNFKGITLSAVLDFSKGGSLVSYTNYWGHGSGILNKTLVWSLDS